MVVLAWLENEKAKHLKMQSLMRLTGTLPICGLLTTLILSLSQETTVIKGMVELLPAVSKPLNYFSNLYSLALFIGLS